MNWLQNDVKREIGIQIEHTQITKREAYYTIILWLLFLAGMILFDVFY